MKRVRMFALAALAGATALSAAAGPLGGFTGGLAGGLDGAFSGGGRNFGAAGGGVLGGEGRFERRIVRPERKAGDAAQRTHDSVASGARGAEGRTRAIDASAQSAATSAAAASSGQSSRGAQGAVDASMLATGSGRPRQTGRDETPDSRPSRIDASAGLHGSGSADATSAGADGSAQASSRYEH